MTGFSLGLVATLMWIAVLTGLAFSFRTAPRPPGQSIREFRATRRRIAKVPGSPGVSSATATQEMLITRHPPKVSPAGNDGRPRAWTDPETNGLIRSLLAAPAEPSSNEMPPDRNGISTTRRPANGRPVTTAPPAPPQAVKGNGKKIRPNAIRTAPVILELSNRFARTDGTVTYIVVDDEGRPQPKDN